MPRKFNVIQYLKPYFKFYPFLLFFAVIITAGNLVVPFVLKDLIDRVIPFRQFSQLEVICLSNVFFYIFRSVIILLHESTSAPDEHTEQVIQHKIERIFTGRTIIAIAHRVTTLVRADRILVMENGKIIQEGRHPELIKSSGVYSRLCSHQKNAATVLK